ncbi:phage tail protein [Bacillus sp. JJ722]|uniref:phage tail protein n=1 Tax=Bacillus sp. JJ722 TaxID=3122973 RepID=UPI002FFE7FD6
MTDLQGNTEALTDVQNVEIQEVIKEDFTISFTSFLTERNSHSYPLLENESVVEYDGHEFCVKKMDEVRNRKTVIAQHIFFDLIDSKKDDIFGGTRTANEVFTWLLSGTGWTFEIVGTIQSTLLPNFGNSNVLALIRSACDSFDCSIKICPNRHLKVGKRVGLDKDEQFRYKHNIKTLKKLVDTTNLTTCVKGIGGNGLTVIYKSPNASLYGERWGDDIENEKITTSESMIERLKQEINDVPEVSIDIDAITLGMDVGIDDGIWTIYEPMGIEFLSYVTSIKSYPFSNKPSVVTLSNVKQTLSDILTQTKIEIDENKKETRSKFEQTNDRITLEVERVDESISKVELKADQIELSVQRVDERVGDAEAQLVIQADQIQSKVSQTDYNGDTISSLINQTAYSVEIEARRIALRGEVTSDNIQVGNEIRLGDSSWNSSKSLIFNDSTYLSANGDRLDIYASNYVNFYATVAFHGGVDGVVATRSDQSVSVSFDSDLSMDVTVNGRTARFKPV